MPKYGIHHLVLTQAVNQSTADPRSDVRAAAHLMQDQKRWANLGAVGPDLFFWAPDYDFVKPFQLYKNIQEVVAIYNDVKETVWGAIQTLGQPVTQTVDTLTPNAKQLLEQLVKEIQETVQLYKAAMNNSLLAGVLEGVNLVADTAGVHSAASAFFDQFFTPKMQHNRPVPEWYWFEVLHYRNTGDFARALVSRAKNGGSPAQRAYALGYLSHVAADLVGHPYVNQVVGGPYRLHVQRHVTAENFMDAWEFQQRLGSSVNRTLVGHLHFPMLDEDKWQFDDVDPLDPGVRDLIYAALKDVFLSRPHPEILDDDADRGFPTPGQIEDTWEILVRVLNGMQYMTVDRPQEPFPGLGDILSDALASLFGSPPSPPGAPSGACSWEDILAFGLTDKSRDCYDEFFDDLADWLEYLGELLHWSFETLAALLDLILTLLLALPIVVLMALLYGIQLLCWEIYQICRRVLALEGFVVPEPQDLDDAHARNLVSPVQCGLVGCRPVPGTGAATDQTYPRRTNLEVSHLVCPPSVGETPPTFASFASSSPATGPAWFIDVAPFDVKALLAYASSTGVGQTTRFNRACADIGNATDLTAFMIATAVESQPSKAHEDATFTNWNLDGDRRYGAKTWEGTVNLPDPENQPASVTGESQL